MWELTIGQQQIVDQQGWNRDTLLGLLVRFIDEQGENKELEEFLQAQADQEESDFQMNLKKAISR